MSFYFTMPGPFLNMNKITACTLRHSTFGSWFVLGIDYRKKYCGDSRQIFPILITHQILNTIYAKDKITIPRKYLLLCSTKIFIILVTNKSPTESRLVIKLTLNQSNWLLNGKIKCFLVSLKPPKEIQAIQTSAQQFWSHLRPIQVLLFFSQPIISFDKPIGFPRYATFYWWNINVNGALSLSTDHLENIQARIIWPWMEDRWSHLA